MIHESEFLSTSMQASTHYSDRISGSAFIKASATNKNETQNKDKPFGSRGGGGEVWCIWFPQILSRLWIRKPKTDSPSWLKQMKVFCESIKPNTSFEFVVNFCLIVVFFLTTQINIICTCTKCCRLQAFHCPTIKYCKKLRVQSHLKRKPLLIPPGRRNIYSISILMARSHCRTRIQTRTLWLQLRVESLQCIAQIQTRIPIPNGCIGNPSPSPNLSLAMWTSHNLCHNS